MKFGSGKSANTTYVLSDAYFRHFRISIRTNGEIEVWKDGDIKPLLKWKDPNPIPVHYYSFCSWENIVVKWILKTHKLPKILSINNMLQIKLADIIQYYLKIFHSLFRASRFIH